MTPDEQAQLVAMYRAGVPVKQICKRLHYGQWVVYDFLKHHRDICPHRAMPGGGLTPSQYELLKKMWRQGVSMVDMGHAVGRTKGVIHHLVTCNRDDFPHRRTRN